MILATCQQWKNKIKAGHAKSRSSRNVRWNQFRKSSVLPNSISSMLKIKISLLCSKATRANCVKTKYYFKPLNIFKRKIYSKNSNLWEMIRKSLTRFLSKSCWISALLIETQSTCFIMIAGGCWSGQAWPIVTMIPCTQNLLESASLSALHNGTKC